MRIRLVCIVTIAATALTPSLAFAQTRAFQQKPFTDVHSTHPNFEAIEYLRKNNILKGYTDGSLKPGALINRAEFVKLIASPYLLNTEQVNDCIVQNVDAASTTVYFRDVKRDAWYAPEVCLAFVKRLIRGYPDSTFRPTTRINFAEAGKILIGVFAPSVAKEPEGEQWYKPYIEKLAQQKAIPETVHSLSEQITRGEMAEMLYRLKTHNTSKVSNTYDQLGR